VLPRPFSQAHRSAGAQPAGAASKETGYTVARVGPGPGGWLVTAVGSLLEAAPGEFLRMWGRWGKPSSAWSAVPGGGLHDGAARDRAGHPPVSANSRGY